MSCRKPCRQRSRECARDVLLAEEHVLPWQIFPQTTMAIHRSSKYCLPAPELPVRFHKKAEIEFQALQCYGELRESLCCRYAISGHPSRKMSQTFPLSLERAHIAGRRSLPGHQKVSSTAMVHPNATTIKTRAVTLLAWGVATLFQQPYASRGKQVRHTTDLSSSQQQKNRTQHLRRLRRYRHRWKIEGCLPGCKTSAGWWSATNDTLRTFSGCSSSAAALSY